MRTRTVLLFALAAVALPKPTIAQTGAPNPKPDATSVPMRIDICEFPKMGILKYHHCGTLTWNGQSYDATFLPLIGPGEQPVDTGAVGTVTMQRTGDSVTFSRVDSSGTEGSSTYQGTISGNRASGTVTWFHAKLPNIKGTWEATFVITPVVPARIEICEFPVMGVLNYHHCGTLTWNGQTYDATFLPLIGPGEQPVDTGAVGTVTMQRNGDSVTFSRVDSVGTEGTSTYQGTISGDTAAGDVTWFHPNLPDIKGTWKATLIMTPGGTPPTPASAQSISGRLEECEEPAPNPFHLRNCGVLTWNGAGYDAAWTGISNGTAPPGPATTAALTLQRVGNAVVLNRVDITGTPGVTGVYRGTVSNDGRVSGTVIWFLQGTAYASGTWTATPK